MGSEIEQTWAMATVQLANEGGKVGTGFFVARQVEGGHRVFLVTNKHVVGKTAADRESAQKVEVGLNIKKDGRIEGKKVTYPIQDVNGKAIWREHPDPDVDVLALDATSIALQLKDMSSKWVDYSLFIDEKKTLELDISMGDEVVVLGYPLGLSQSTSFLPMLKSGTLSSKLGLRIHEVVRAEDGSPRSRQLPAFFVDGAIIPGSSGSPVVLKPVPGRIVKGNVVLGSPAPFLLGIISATKTFELETPGGPVVSIPGLAIAFDAHTIRDTIEAFFV